MLWLQKMKKCRRAIADAVTPFNVSIFGMANTAHEKIYKEGKKT